MFVVFRITSKKIQLVVHFAPFFLNKNIPKNELQEKICTSVFEKISAVSKNYNTTKNEILH